MTKRISILGSTGSIGVSTIDLVHRHPDRFQVVGLAAGANLDLLVQQVRNLKPKIVSVKSATDAQQLKTILNDASVEIVHGSEGACQVAGLAEADTVISAIVGAAGLLPTLEAVKKGKVIGLANKESMVIAGEIMRREADQHSSRILPVDSEHSALFQCMEGHDQKGLSKLILTASGGPFLNKPLEEFSKITIQDALKHPNWDMGPKITIDSSTMMNKGLEVMEARWLFDISALKIDVCVHPQSIIHSMVEYVDGSVMAHLGVPDMRVPIAYALSYPERIETGVPMLNLFKKRELTFFEPDFVKFPCLKLAYDVAAKGLSYPAVLNAANEVAVEAFLKGKIPYLSIYSVIHQTIESHSPWELKALDDVIESDRWARDAASKHINHA